MAGVGVGPDARWARRAPVVSGAIGFRAGHSELEGRLGMRPEASWNRTAQI